MSDSNDIPSDSAYPPQTEVAQTEKKSGCGCFAIGCLTLLGVGFVALAVMVGGGVWFFRGQVQKYTSETPAEIPVVEYTEEEITELQTRIESFKTGVEGGDSDGDPSEADVSEPPPPPPKELVLTDEEINALIASEEELRGRVHVSIDNGEITGDVSIPTDGFPGGSGRFLNASATFNVSMENGVLIVKITRADVKGEPIPKSIMQELSKQNLAKDLYKDEETSEILRKFESVRVEDNKLILRLREDLSPPVDDEPAPAPTVDDEPAPAPTVDDEPAPAPTDNGAQPPADEV